MARPRWSRPALLLPVSMLAAATLGAGCPVASSICYTGASDAERKLLTQADRRVFPDDVRKDVDRFKKVPVAWTGIIRAIRPGPAPGTSELDIEHHYWDWIEDHSIQKAKAFLSQRGEGSFSCHLDRPVPAAVGPGWMVIAYGSPVGTIKPLALDCVVSVYPPSWYATDIFDYGREYLLHGDQRDFRMLRVPMQ